MRSLQIRRHTEPQSATARAPRAIQPKLRIGPANDPLEREADQIADAVTSNQMLAAGLSSAGQGIQRKCAACENEERDTVRLQREDGVDEEILTKPDGNAGGTRSADAAQGAASAVSGGGAPLAAAERAYFEPRFGHNFSDVRIHTHHEAQRASEAMGARAFTLGRDIAFASGQFETQSRAGRHLLAHELAHVVQQDGRPGDRTVRRRLKVDKPSTMIPDPGGKGVKQTNAQTIEQYIATLCKEGGFTVAKSGDVGATGGFCSKSLLGADILGPLDTNEERVKSVTGCDCLCDMIKSKNDWKIIVDDSSWPHTRFSDQKNAHNKGSGGSGGIVTAPSPNSTKLWGATTKSGVDLNIDSWLVLGHELCGHGWLGDRGEHAPDRAKPRGSGGHQATVARENLLRREHGIEERGGYRDPYCGESFWREKSSPGTVNRSSHLKECERWRDAYNKKHGKKYTLKDRIPP